MHDLGMATVFSNCILEVSDLGRSLAFYRDLLDLPVRKEERADGHRLAYLRTGGADILLVQQPFSEQLQGFERGGGLVLNFHVTNLDLVAHRAGQAGVKVLRPMEDEGLGERSMLLADPDGYTVMLSEPLGSTY